MCPGIIQPPGQEPVPGTEASLGNIPFEVANDGEVTALAGSMALGCNGVLGMALGTSTAGGYVTATAISLPG